MTSPRPFQSFPPQCVGLRDPGGKRRQFLQQVRELATEARTPIARATELEKDDANGQLARRVAVVSLGNGREAHGPCLPLDIDDRVSGHVAVAVSNETGARYLGPVPYCTDGIGDLAKSWSTTYLPYEKFFEKFAQFVNHLLIAHYEERGEARPDVLYVVSGHGGNHIMTRDLKRLAQACQVGYVQYGSAIVDKYAQHAGVVEHSVAARLGLGCFDGGALAECNLRLSASDRSCFDCLSQYPAFGGMAGFYLFGGPAFNAIRERYRGVKRAVQELVENRTLDVSQQAGARVLEHSIRTNSERLLKFAKSIGIDLSPRILDGLNSLTEQRQLEFQFSITEPSSHSGIGMGNGDPVCRSDERRI